MIYKQKFQGQWISNWRFKFVRIASRKKKICWTSHEETCQGIFKVLLRISSTWSLQWVCKTTTRDSTYFELQVVIAVCYLGEPRKKSFECHSREQKTAFSELTFELASMLSLQWFCKSVIPDSTYFELKVLRAECVSLESHKKKICWLSQQGTEKSIFRVIFRIGFGIMTAMILQNTISRFNFFRIESFHSWVILFWKAMKIKNCWMSQQLTEKLISRDIFWIEFAVMT